MQWLVYTCIAMFSAVVGLCYVQCSGWVVIMYFLLKSGACRGNDLAAGIFNAGLTTGVKRNL